MKPSNIYLETKMKHALVIISVLLFCALFSATAQALCVKTSKANLRVGPGLTYMKSWEVGRHMPFEKIGVSLSGEWYAVKDVDGDTHWIHKKLLDENCRCAVATGDNTPLRTGPGIKYGKVDPVKINKYHCFQILEKRNDWIKVRDAWKNEGWIYKKFLWIR
jgi:SH3-like domain-containing protein